MAVRLITILGIGCGPLGEGFQRVSA